MNNIKSVIAVSLCLAFYIGGGSIGVTLLTESSFTASVKNTERVCTGGETVTCEYLVYTDVETLENTDVIWYLKYNSGDIQSSLEKGKTYIFRVYGFRIPFLSVHRNIISVKEES